MANDIDSRHDSLPEHAIYSKFPATIDEQLSILAARGMIIDDLPSAKLFLSENYFHRFLSYSVPFFRSVSANLSKFYRDGVKFSDVINIYEFDSKLRLLLLDAIEKIEISIKTQFINLSAKYGAHFYLSHKLFRDHKLLNDSIERLQYQMRASNDLLVNEYFAKYDNPNLPPVWVAMELLSIGQMAKWLLNLKRDEDRQTVARHYHLHYSILRAVIDNLTLIRNYSAHHARIWNRHYDFAECVCDSNNELIKDTLCISDGRIYRVLILIAYILRCIGGDKEFVMNLFDIIHKYQIDVKQMGFPDDWQAKFHGILDLAL